jgi:SAM-dependent methyltransferase
VDARQFFAILVAVLARHPLSANVGLPTLAQAFTTSFQEVQRIVLAYLLAISTRSVKFGIMNENPAATDWTVARGQKWHSQLAGIEVTLTPVDEPPIRALSVDAPSRIADIGCGGRGTTLEICRRAPAGGVVYGFDLSPALIELARNCERSDERNIALEIAQHGVTDCAGRAL